MVLLETKGLSKLFGGVVALSKLDLRVEESGILGIIGPNGAGKTTLFNVISGHFSPSEGRVIFDGKDVTRLKSHRLSELGIVRTWQRPRPFSSQTVLQNVLIGATFGVKGRNASLAEKIALERIQEASLTEKAQAKASTLNLGEERRMEIARALATEPRLLLLDEPFAGLNPSETNELMKLFRNVGNKNITILMVEHVLKAVMNLCQKVVVLNHGVKIAEGKPQEIATDKQVIDAYLGESYSPSGQ